MTGARGQLPFEFSHEPDFREEAFIVAACNQAARAWIERWPEWPGPGLAVHGPAGSGKTHLSAIWQARSEAAAIDPAALEPARVPELLGDARAALIDWPGDPTLSPAGEQALVHLYNLLAEQGGHLLLLARTPPARWPIRLADLRSRLAALPAIRIDPPDDELLQALFAKLLADRQLEATPDAIAYLLARMERSFDAARSLVAELDRRALATGRKITISLVRETLAGSGETAPDRT
ncbi:MAG: DnaA/Hda family protein [Rhodospirillaceae bacterium]|nr:DnaA/Hda family protein [Rhodospirillaceae bacterium]